MLQFGVEIEVSYPNPSVPILPPEWRYWSDCSIKPFGLEFVSPVFFWEERGQVFNVVESLQPEGASCNQSCGLHIHMSGVFPEWKKIVEVGEKWYKSIKAGFRPARQRRGYCVELIELTSREKYRMIRPVQISNGRTHLEVRLFNAHLNKRWIARCLGVTKQLGEVLEQQTLVAV